MNKFDKTRNSNQQYDMVSLFQSAEERTMRHVHVSSLAKVKAVNGNNVVAMLFPKREGTDAIEINAYNLFNSAINVGDTILIVFTDRDFNVNLATISQDNNSVAETGDDDLHSLSNAIAIKTTSEKQGEGDFVPIAELAEAKEVNKDDKFAILQNGETKSVKFSTLTIDNIDLTNILSK